MSTYNIFLDHNAPFNYYPYGVLSRAGVDRAYLFYVDPYWTPDLKAGWAPWNDVTGGYDPDGNLSVASGGRSSHRTQQDNAMVELYFNGSSITLFGEMDAGCGIDVWLDGVSSSASPSNGRLAEFSGLERKEHRILVTAHPSNNGNVSFYGAQIGVSVEPASLASTDQADVPVDYGVDWIHQSASTAGNTALGDYHETTKLGAYINVTLRQTSAVTVYGFRGLNAGKYNVSLDGSSPHTHIAKSSFQTRSILFFATDLDASVDHHLVLTNIEEGNHLAIASINVTTIAMHEDPNTGSRAFTVPRGTAIALITAVVAAFLILVLITACFLIRRRRQNVQRIKRNQHFVVVPREFSPKYPSFTMNDEAVTKSRHDPVIVVAASNGHSRNRSLYHNDDREPEEEDDDGSFQFVRRPLLGPTPSIRMPNLGPSFHVDFPSASSGKPNSRKSSKRSVRTVSEHVHYAQPDNRETSDQTNFLHLHDSSASTDAQSPRASSEADRHRSRVRFSTPPIFTQLFRHPFAWAGGIGGGQTGQASRPNRRSFRSSRSTMNEPNTPITIESIPFTVGTSVEFEHPESTPPRSLEDTREESSSDARNLEDGTRTDTDTDGFIPHSARRRSE